MPLERTYKGRKVTRVKRVSKGIRLTFENSQPGEVHPRKVITQEQWDRDVETTYVSTPPKPA
jgi:hypothetical protein